jgi:hypothetical protein
MGRTINGITGESILRIGKMQPDTIGVELDDFPGVLFVCRVPDCTDPESIIEETLGTLFFNIEVDNALSFGPGSKNPEKSNRWFRAVNITRGFVGDDKKVALGKGKKIILERNGSILIVSSESPNMLEVNNFLRTTGAIRS